MDETNDKIRETIPLQSSVKLAEMIVCYRYIGIYKEASMLAMEELGKRRLAGDMFDYEKYVEDKLAGLPKLDVKKPGIGSMFGMLGKMVGGKK
jgi:hypothetical protein